MKDVAEAVARGGGGEAVNGERAGGGRSETGEEAQAGGFAATAGADEGDEIARRGGEGEVGENLGAGIEALADGVERDARSLIAGGGGGGHRVKMRREFSHANRKRGRADCGCLAGSRKARAEATALRREGRRGMRLPAGCGVGETCWVKIVVLDAATLDFPDSAWEGLRAHGEVTLHPLTPSDQAVIAERCAGAEVVLTNKVPLEAATLGALPALRLVSVLATGYNIVDAKAARARGVVVCNVPGYSTMSVVQHTLALILEWTNQTGLHNAAVAAGEWMRSERFCFWKTPIRELAGDTVGIIGFGSIGARVAEVLHGLGANVLANSRSRKGAPAWGPFAWAEVEEIFENADVVTLHCPQTPENTRFVNAELLARMKPTALLVNTARGGLIDEAALAAALKAGRPAAAALDVVTHEPMRADCPLLGVPNCLITPHVAWASEKARRRLLAITAENLRAFAAGVPQNVVN